MSLVGVQTTALTSLLTHWSASSIISPYLGLLTKLIPEKRKCMHVGTNRSRRISAGWPSGEASVWA